MALEGFGARLKALRQERGYTQKQLSGLLGITEQAVSKYERGSNYPDITVLNGMAEVLDCSLDYLFAHEPGKRNLSDLDSLERKAAVNQLLLPDIITLQFGEKLVPLFMEETKQKFPHITGLRKQIAQQWGISLPVIRMRDQIRMAPEQYEILINGISFYQDTLDAAYPEAMMIMLGKLKEMVFQNIDQVLNNQSVYDMIENLRQKMPCVVDGIVPEVISWSRLCQVLVSLIKDQGYTVNPLVLILESMERHLDISDPKQLAEKVASELNPGFRFENWVK